MPLNIPMPKSFGESLLQGMETGGNLYSRIMQPIVNREEIAGRKAISEAQLAQQMKVHQDNLAIQRMTQARLAELAPLQRHLAELNIQKAEMETDPAKKMAYINSILQGIGGMQGGQQAGTPQAQSMQPMAGMGMPSMEEMQNPTPQIPQGQPQAPSQQALQQGFGGFSPEQQMAMGLAGIKMPVLRELPEQKRQAETVQAGIQEQQKLDINKVSALRQEIPEAQELIDKIEEAKTIINKNKKLFGPGVGGLNFLGGPTQRKRGLKTKEEREAWGKIEDLFGTLVGKKATDFSHRGLKVAFDLASATKPSFEEYPETVISKLDAMLKGLKSGHARDVEWYKGHGGTVAQKRMKFNPATGRLE